MSVCNFEDLKAHIGHEIKCVCYRSKKSDIQNVAVECEDCNEVILSFDKSIKKKGGDIKNV